LKFGYKNLIAVLSIIAILVAVSGCTSTSNNTTNNTTNNNSNNIVVNNSTNHNTTNYISAAKAKSLATSYTGMGVTLGTPTLTSLNGVKVWKVPVKTVGTDESVDSIYINAITGKRVQ
jgi:maltose-binding protein MalE